jgi:CheY-like chemotaxis protein
MCHVLIIEDEAVVALDVQMILAENGATSFDIVETEQDALEAALMHRPAFIASDVHLRRGTGPKAVQAIHQLLGEMPVVFITATPEACLPCAPPGRIVPKPIRETDVARAFREMAFP